jgi:hypothetical protein
MEPKAEQVQMIVEQFLEVQMADEFRLIYKSQLELLSMD